MLGKLSQRMIATVQHITFIK